MSADAWFSVHVHKEEDQRKTKHQLVNNSTSKCTNGIKERRGGCVRTTVQTPIIANNQLAKKHAHATMFVQQRVTFEPCWLFLRTHANHSSPPFGRVRVFLECGAFTWKLTGDPDLGPDQPVSGISVTRVVSQLSNTTSCTDECATSSNTNARMIAPRTQLNGEVTQFCRTNRT